MKREKIVISKSIFDVREAFRNILNDEKFITDKCYDAIKYGIENDILQMVIVEFKMSTGRTYEVKCHRNKWEEVLNDCMTFYIKKEEYEKCGEIVKLLKILNA